jgi:hypothetical protein
MKEGTPIAMVRIVLDLFKGKELAIDAACGLLNRGYRNALEVGSMLDPENETYSKSRTS